MDVLKLEHKALNDEDMGNDPRRKSNKQNIDSELRQIDELDKFMDKLNRLVQYSVCRQTGQGALGCLVKVKRYI